MLIATPSGSSRILDFPNQVVEGIVEENRDHARFADVQVAHVQRIDRNPGQRDWVILYRQHQRPPRSRNSLR